MTNYQQRLDIWLLTPHCLSLSSAIRRISFFGNIQMISCSCLPEIVKVMTSTWPSQFVLGYALMLAFSPRMRRLVTSCSWTCKVWNIEHCWNLVENFGHQCLSIPQEEGKEIDHEHQWSVSPPCKIVLVDKFPSWKSALFSPLCWRLQASAVDPTWAWNLPYFYLDCNKFNKATVSQTSVWSSLHQPMVLASSQPGSQKLALDPTSCEPTPK